MKRTDKPMEKRVLTIPNLMSMFRLALIPVIIWLYVFAKRDMAAAVVLVVSGLTDVADGQIARRFHMVSDVGKILDPIADKLTQFTVLLCLCTRFHAMAVPAALLFVKELVDGLVGLRVVRRTGAVYSAEWHGKLSTVLLYTLLFVHICWPEMPAAVSNGLVALCVAAMALSLFLYCRRNYRVLKDLKDQQKEP